MTTDSNDNASRGAAIPRLLRDGIDTLGARSSDAAELARETAAKALDTARDGLDTARDALGEAYASGRGKATTLYSAGRDRTNEAYAAARARIHATGESASERLGASPLAAVFGGVAIGLVLGALLPRTERETRLLGGAGDKLNDLAREALGAAKAAGEAKLADLGLTPAKARESLQTLIDGAMAAATSAGTAAVDTARAQGKPAAGK
ncbi:MAG TPA: hypothetical protein VGC10_10295 [Sphingomonas sp.]